MGYCFFTLSEGKVIAGIVAKTYIRGEITVTSYPKILYIYILVVCGSKTHVHQRQTLLSPHLCLYNWTLPNIVFIEAYTLSVRTVVLGMTQVCQHYAHTFEKFKFHFHYESDPTFDRLARFVWSKKGCTPNVVKIARLVLNPFKKARFQFLLYM